MTTPSHESHDTAAGHESHGSIEGHTDTHHAQTATVVSADTTGQILARLAAVERAVLDLGQRLHRHQDRSAGADSDFAAAQEESGADPGRVVPPGHLRCSGSPTVPLLPDAEVLYAWVQRQVVPRVHGAARFRRSRGRRWCGQWWRHTEALERCSALYLTFSELSGSSAQTWLSVYLRDHLDPHLAALTSRHGPFHACTPSRHRDAGHEVGRELVTEPASAAAGQLPPWVGGQP